MSWWTALLAAVLVHGGLPPASGQAGYPEDPWSWFAASGNGSRISAIHVHTSTGDVFAASQRPCSTAGQACSTLYQLGSDLQLKQKADVGAYLDHPVCFHPSFECLYKKSPEGDVIQFLEVVNTTRGPMLLSCGRVYRGLCRMHNLRNISEMTWVGPYNETEGFVLGAQLNEILVEPGGDTGGGLTVYAASAMRSRQHHHPDFLSIRTLQEEEGGQGFRFVYKYSPINFEKNTKKSPVYMFTHEDYIYVVLIEFDPATDTVTSKVARYYRKGATPPDGQPTYAEIPVWCEVAGARFPVSRAAFFGPATSTMEAEGERAALWVIFYDLNFRQSALCAKPLSALLAAFDETSRACRAGLGHVRVLDSESRPGRPCPKQEESFPSNFPQIQNLRSLDFIMFYNSTRLISVNVFKQKGSTVAYTGNFAGIITKVNLDIPTMLSFSDVLPKHVFSDIENPIQRSLAERSLYFSTYNKVIKYPTETCSVYQKCDHCVFLSLGDPLQCGWCGDKCVSVDECFGPFKRDFCSPVIYEVSPMKASSNSSTLVTIVGDSFGLPDINSRVLIAGSRCSIVTWTSENITCTATKGDRSEGAVEVVVERSVLPKTSIPTRGVYTTTQKFRFEDSAFHGFNIRRGSIFGGQNMTFFGKNLNTGTINAIIICGQNCTRIRASEDIAWCLTPAWQERADCDQPVTMVVDGVSLTPDPSLSEHPVYGLFQYEPPPEVLQLHPAETTSCEKRTLTVRGVNIPPNATVDIVATFPSPSSGRLLESRETCQAVGDASGGTWTCPTPPMPGPLAASFSRTQFLPATVAFASPALPGIRQPPDLRLTYLPPPSVHPFRQSIPVPHGEDTLQIEGKNLNSAYAPGDFRVTVGQSDECQVLSVEFDVLKCKLPNSLLNNNSLRGAPLLVEVVVGCTTVTVGDIELVQGPFSLWWLLLVIPVVVLILVVFFYTRKRCIRKQKTGQHELAAQQQTARAYRRVPCSAPDLPPRPARDPPLAVAGNRGHFYDYKGNSNVQRNPAAVREGVMQNSQHSSGSCTPGSRAAAPQNNDECGGRRRGKALDRNTMRAFEVKGMIIPKEWIQFGGALGSGRFGCVRSGTYTRPGDAVGRAVAVKEPDNSDPIMPWQDFVDEALIMMNIRNENILSLIGVCCVDGCLWLVTDFMQNGNLETYIRNGDNRLYQSDLIRFSCDTSAGMAYLARYKYVHRDLATRNLLLDGQLRVKLSDFGLSVEVYEKLYFRDGAKKTPLPVRWMALESLEKAVYDNKTDVWSFGVVLWELFTRGAMPYEGIKVEELIAGLKVGKRLPQPEHCPDDIYRVMRLCWMENPTQRPTFDVLEQVLLRAAGESGRQVPAQNRFYVNNDPGHAEVLYLPMDGRAR